MSTEVQLKRTPLYESHRRLNARLVEFGGWEMPVQYDGILAEHNAVRTDCGIFDISHMGEVRVSGPQALAFLNHLLTNDLARLSVSQGQYNLMCNARGGTVDDLYAYRIGEQEYLLIINASRVEEDVPHIRQVAQTFLSVPSETDLQIENCSDYAAAIAVQGPRSAAVMETLLPGIAAEVKRNRIVWKSLVNENVLVARTGYTGEDGFELVMHVDAAVSVWDLLLKQGAKPCGLGARDTLRTEMCYPLYGHELDEETSAIEAGLAKFVALSKPSFVGKEHLQRQTLSGTSKTLVAFRMNGRSAPPRQHYPLVVGGQAVGEVTSGTQSPSLGVGIGMGYVPPGCATSGEPLEVEIRGKRFLAEIVTKPIYRKNG